MELTEVRMNRLILSVGVDTANSIKELNDSLKNRENPNITKISNLIKKVSVDIHCHGKDKMLMHYLISDEKLEKNIKNGNIDVSLREVVLYLNAIYPADL